ncbi:MAG: hypothetical protein HQK49_07730 [Oligoflexia bacterium]|nr:hypothetical protein [Oligoflexia bacterium]
MNKKILVILVLFFYTFSLLFSLLLAEERICNNEKFALTVPVLVEGEELAVLWITPNQQPEKFLLEANGMSKILEGIVEDSIMLRLKLIIENAKNSCLNSTSTSTSINIKDLQQLNIDYKYDENLLSLELIIPAELRKKNIVNLLAVNQSANQSSNSVDVNASSRANDFTFNGSSFYLNTNLGRVYSNQKRETEFDESNSFFSNFQFVGNIYNLILESNHEYFSEREHSWTRGNSRLIHDDRKHLVRYIVGDSEYPLMGFQSSSAGAGVAIFRDYAINAQNLTKTNSLANSYSSAVTSNSGNSLILKRSSLLEVYLNGSLVDKKTLPAGPFDLTNIPFSSGENNLILKITDNLGNVEQINISQLYHGEILAATTSEFLVSYDYPSYVEDYQKKYDSSKGRGTFFYRYGIKDQLNLGGNLQLNRDDQLLGVECKFLTPIALIANNLAYSGSKGEDKDKGDANREKKYALAFKTEINSLEKWGKREALFLWRASLRVQDVYFKAVGESPSSLRLYSDLYLIKRFIELGNLSVGGGLVYQDNRFPQTDTLSFKFDLSKSFAREFNFGINYTQELKSANDKGEKGEKRILFMLTWVDSKGQMQGSSSYNTFDKNSATQFQHRYSKGHESLSSGILYNENENQKNLGADVNYLASRFESRVAHALTRNKNPASSTSSASSASDADKHSGEVTMRFALAYANSLFAFGRPISDSFAIINTDPPSKKYSIPINRSYNFAIAEINYFGSALVPSIRPYSRENLFLDSAELPMGENLAFENITILNSYKSGVGIKIALTKKRSVVAYIKDSRGNNLTLKTGKVFSFGNGVKDEMMAEFFSNREGRIFIDEISTQNLKLKLVIDDNRYDPLEIDLQKYLEKTSNESDTVTSTFDLGTLIFNRND